MRRKSSARAGFLLTALLALSVPPACGQGDSKSPPKGPDGLEFDETIDRYKIGMTTGRLQRSELESRGGPFAIMTPLGQADVGADGSYSVLGFVNSPTPAMILNGAKEVVSFAFMEPSGTVFDNALAAKSLAMMASKGMFLQVAVRWNYWKNLGTAPEVIALADDLRAMGGHFAGGPEETRARVTTRIGALVKRLRAGPKALRITPADGKGGVEVLQQGLNEIVVVNHFRRRADAFVERIGVTLEDGTEETRQDTITNFPILPVTVPTSVAAAVADAGTVLGDQNSAFSGSVSFIDTVTAPLQVMLVPATAKMTTYRVVVTGPGAVAGSVANITQEMKDHNSLRWMETFAVDVALPLLMNLIGPMLNSAPDKFWVSLNPNQQQQVINALKDLATQMYTLPTVQTQLAAGDIQGALSTSINAVLTSGAFASLRNEAILKLATFFIPNVDLAATGRWVDLNRINKTMQFIDYLLQGADWAAVAYGIGASAQYEEFVVDVLKTRVKLTPQAAKVSIKGSEAFQATVPDATGSEAPLVTYKFKLTSGTNMVQLKNAVNGMLGTELGSSNGAMIVESMNNMVGTAGLEVEAILVSPGSERSLGKAYATIRVVNDKAVLSPAKSSIRSRETKVLAVRINNARPESIYMFSWSSSNRVGSIDRTEQRTSRNTVTYTSSGPNGNDVVTVKVYQQGPGGFVRIGEASATVLVETEPTIIDAAYKWEIHNTECYAIVTFTKPPGFTSFRLVGEGGYDFAYYADHIDLGAPPAQALGDGAINLTGSTFGWGLSSGSSRNPAEFVPWMDARFGGFSFYVVATK